ncbi:hypothetical protein QQS21_007868 [Conoideocrella luteorostrata]|uniref:Rhodopsin domain-containing protein n=1 Tax=Conoideocrella luteorostrata TaxID=1105319 RepID=A0AAJ0CK21_9HYPO|nr:hypothetical protein QQS21_007868 [Conoideocrella luteorostrata]
MNNNSTNIPPDVLAALPDELKKQIPLYDQTAQPKIRVVLAICTIIAYIALGLRLYARRITKQAFGLDDLFAGLAVFVINTLLVLLITNVALDAVILCLPLPLIWRLKINLKKKLQLTLIFTLGSFIFVISILRVVAAYKLHPLGDKPDSTDNNWDSIDVELWAIAESAVSIITISLPVMRPILRQAIYRKDGSSRFKAAAKDGKPSENGNEGSNRPTGLLTFGRSGIKGPSGRKPRGLNATNISTATRNKLDEFLSNLPFVDQNQVFDEELLVKLSGDVTTPEDAGLTKDLYGSFKQNGEDCELGVSNQHDLVHRNTLPLIWNKITTDFERPDLSPTEDVSDCWDGHFPRAWIHFRDPSAYQQNLPIQGVDSQSENSPLYYKIAARWGQKYGNSIHENMALAALIQFACISSETTFEDDLGASSVKDNIISWLEVIYKLAVGGGISENNRLDLHLEQYFDHGTKPSSSDSIRGLLMGTTPSYSKPIFAHGALGSCLHVIQDSYALGHCQQHLENPGGKISTTLKQYLWEKSYFMEAVGS